MDISRVLIGKNSQYRIVYNPDQLFFPYSTKEFVQRHISEAYHDNIVEEVQVAYDVSKLSWLDQKRDNASKARLYCENNASKYGAGQQMKPATCGIMCMACNCTHGKCCQNSVDALTFYRKEEEDYTHEVTREKARVMTKSIGMHTYVKNY